MSVTKGLIKRIMTNNTSTPVLGNLQLQDVMVVKAGVDRYKAICSDGESTAQGIMATQLSKMVNEGDIIKNCIFHLDKYVLQPHPTTGKNMLLILGLTVVQLNADPIPLSEGPKDKMDIESPKKPSVMLPPAPLKTPSASGPIVRASPGVKCTPIAGLNPYQNRWTIKAAVMSKGEKKEWSNDRGSGCLFKIDLQDDDGSEISAAFFKDAVTKFYDMLEVGNIYTFSRGKIKMANKKFRNNNCDYEINFDTMSEICLVDDGSRIQMSYNFTKLDSLEQYAGTNVPVDVLAVVKSYTECLSLTTKKGRETQKRDLKLVDDTNLEVSVTLWGSHADNAELWEGCPVVAFKKLRVSDYNGCSLGTLDSSMIVPKPEGVSEAEELESWFSSAGKYNTPVSISKSTGGSRGGDVTIANRKQLEAIDEEQLGTTSEKGDYVNVKATITSVRHPGNGRTENNPWYVAEPETKYKCSEQSDGTWFCERSNKTVENPVRRYILQCQIGDASGFRYVSFFNDQAETILGGITADQLHELQEQDASLGQQHYKNACFKTFNMSLRIKQETYNGESRVKCICTNLAPVDFTLECKQLSEAIKAYETWS